MSWDDPWRRYERERERMRWDPFYRYEKHLERMQWDPFYRYDKHLERMSWDPFYRYEKEQQRLREDRWYRQAHFMDRPDHYSAYSGLSRGYGGMGAGPSPHPTLDDEAGKRIEEERRRNRLGWFSRLLRKLFWFRYDDAPLW